jgi:uncharacterized protein
MSPAAVEARAFEADGVRGFLHAAEGAVDGLALTHGAGGNCDAPLLIAVAKAFQAAGLSVLRYDLPFRQERRSGPPFPAKAAGDREGVRKAAAALRVFLTGRIYLGGHSYGGRQTSMAAAEAPDLAEALLLLSYPLHPPSKPSELRTAHFASLRTPALFVHGTGDSFGSIAEMERALALTAGPTSLIAIQGAGHDLKRGRFDLAALVPALTGMAASAPTAKRRETR